MVVSGKSESPAGLSPKFKEGIEMAFLNSVSNMEGPNSVLSSPGPSFSMDSESLQLPFSSMEDSLTLSDFVNPLAIFSDTVKATNENNNQQPVERIVNVLEDLEAYPIDVEKMLEDCFILPEVGAFQQTRNMEPLPLQPATEVDDDIVKLVLELDNISGAIDESFDIVSYVEQNSPSATIVPEIKTAGPTAVTASPQAVVKTDQVEEARNCKSNTAQAKKGGLKRGQQEETKTIEAQTSSKRKKVSVPDLSPLKADDIKRERNKEASRKSRQKRRLREAEMEEQADRLTDQNKQLLEQISLLESLKSQLETEIKKVFPTSKS